MINLAYRPPGRECRFADDGLDHAGLRQEILQVVRAAGAVEVAHDDVIGGVRDQFAHKMHLPDAATLSKRQMNQHHGETLIALSEFYHHGATATQSRQTMVMHGSGFIAAQESVAKLPEMANVTVNLDIPVGKAGAMCQVFGLINKG